jgi:hypothetical protein
VNSFRKKLVGTKGVPFKTIIPPPSLVKIARRARGRRTNRLHRLASRIPLRRIVLKRNKFFR